MVDSALRSRIGQPSSNDPFARLIAEIVRTPGDGAFPTFASGPGRSAEALEGGSDSPGQGGSLPALTIRRTGTTVSVEVQNTELGLEMSSAVLALLRIGGRPPSGGFSTA